MPNFVFNKEMTNKQRSDSLQQIEEWTREAKMSETKRTILMKTIEFVKKKLPSFNVGSFAMDAGDFALCQVILQHADLSDLLFFQHVINQEKISKDANPLFQDFILLATDAKKTMHIPLVYQTRTAAGALGILSLFTQSKLGILAAVLTFVFADEIQNWRISHSLENKLALKKIGGEMPVVEDGFDNIQKGVTHVAKEGFNSAVNFFKNQVFSNLTMPEENKHVASPKGM